MGEDKKKFMDTVSEDPFVKTSVGIGIGFLAGKNLDKIVSGTRNMINDVTKGAKNTYNKISDKTKSINYKSAGIKVVTMGLSIFGGKAAGDAIADKYVKDDKKKDLYKND